jgi:hypothetical protein
MRVKAKHISISTEGFKEGVVSLGEYNDERVFDLSSLQMDPPSLAEGKGEVALVHEG